jgi:hypothetical protein
MVGEIGEKALSVTVEVRESAGDLLEDAVDAVRNVGGSALEVVGDAMEEGKDLASRRLGEVMRTNPRLVRAIQPVGACMGIVVGAASDVRARLETVVEVQIDKDPENPLSPYQTSSGRNGLSTITSAERMRIVFHGDSILPGNSFVTLASGDGFELTVRCLPFMELEVALRGPDGGSRQSRFVLHVDEWGIGSGPHKERLCVMRYRRRDFSLFVAPELTSRGRGRFRRLHVMRF